MDPLLIFALVGCVLSGALVYVMLQVKHFGETQKLQDQLLLAQADAAAQKKKLAGLTSYPKHLAAVAQQLPQSIKPPVLKVTREYVLVHTIAKDTLKLKADATVVIKYSAEFGFALDLGPGALEITQTSSGVSVKLPRPSLASEPFIKAGTPQIISSADIIDRAAVLAPANAMLSAQARAYGQAASTEELVRNACRLRVLEWVRDTLAQQAGVSQPPAVYVDFK
ncbi:MAG: hypothetical protein Fur007_04380 [Rhodoferax sp.]